MTPVICMCGLVTAESIEYAVRNGADTYEKISKKTRVGMGCQTCYFDVQEIIVRTNLQMRNEEKLKSGSQMELF